MNRTIRMLGVLFFALVPAQTASAGGIHCDSPPTEGVTTVVDITKGCFAPTVARIAPGATVRFTNLDPVPHNLVGHAVNWGQADPLATGQEIEAAFDEAGLYPFACTLHPGMVGVVVVEDQSVAPASIINDQGGEEGPTPAAATPTGAPGWLYGAAGAAAAGLLAIGWRAQNRTRAGEVGPAVG